MLVFAFVAGFFALVFAGIARVVLAPITFLLRKLDERPATGRTRYLAG